MPPLIDGIPQEGQRVKKKKIAGMMDEEREKKDGMMMAKAPARAMFAANTAVPQPQFLPKSEWNTESYNTLQENGFINTTNDPLSTFSIDVDTASYSNMRRFINEGRLPPQGAVRIEEMINYFSYDYPQPNDKHPFSVTTEVGPCPWQDSRKLVRIGLKAKDIDKKDLPPSNLVFLIDVSGSMSAPNKLPLLQKSMKMLVKQLGRNDRISIVVYAGHDQVVLPPT
ncbi:MAG: VWA domain-containing protein, partial [Candidatus Electrothrix sp. GM3_4]|nr:VWA domain-containing protein [Candidatus Electrothrix sp. GM3_4]